MGSLPKGRFVIIERSHSALSPISFSLENYWNSEVQRRSYRLIFVNTVVLIANYDNNY